MDNSFDQYETEAQSKSNFPANLLKILGDGIDWILSPFLLTEEEKAEAGVYIGYMGEDE